MKKNTILTTLLLTALLVSCGNEGIDPTKLPVEAASPLSSPSETESSPSTEAQTTEKSDGYVVVKANDQPAITVSVPPGIYTPENRPDTVYLTTDTGYAIKYTSTTCQDPTAASGFAEGNLRLAYHETGDGVTEMAIIRAALFDRGTQVGNSYTFTYISAPEGRFTTPVFSLVSDPVGLYSHETGILVEGKAREEALKNGNPPGWVLSNTNANFYNSGREWERALSIEFAEAGEGMYNFSSNGGVRVNGGWTRANIQKSLKLFSRKDYTPAYGTFAVDLFPGYRDPNTGRTLSFANTILLRGGSNNEGNNVIATPFQLAMCEGTSQILPAMRPVTEFINGQYRGMVFIIEDYDADFIEAHFGVPEEELAIFSGSYENYGGSMWTLDTGPESEFALFMETLGKLSKLDMREVENYAYACEVLDIRNFIEYMCIEMYCGNSDWPDNNLRVFRRYTDGFQPDATGVYDGRYRFLLKDLDLSFGNGHAVSKNPFEAVSGGSAMKIREVFNRLMRNEDFSGKVYMYLSTLADTVFAPDRAEEVLNRFILALTPEMKYTTEKLWVGGGSVSRWQGYTEGLLSFAKGRPLTVLNAVERKSKEKHSTLTVSLPNAEECAVELGWYATRDGAEVRYPMNTPIPYRLDGTAEITLTGGTVTGNGTEGTIVLTEPTAALTIAVITPEPAVTVYGPEEAVVINEISHKNYDTVFVELYNRSSEPVSLDGYTIGTKETLALDGITLDPYQFLLISDDPEAADLALSFKMSSKHTLTLQKDGVTVDSLSLDTVNRTVQMGRYPNGDGWRTLYTTELTPGEANTLHPAKDYIVSSIHDGLMVGEDFYPVSEMELTEDGHPAIPMSVVRNFIRDHKSAYKNELKWANQRINTVIPFEEFLSFVEENTRLTVRYVTSANVIILK